MTSRGYLPQLDGIRALAALAVVGYHVTSAPILDDGSIGVTVFFVLSGYLITGLLLDELERRSGIDLGRFYLRRMGRLFPALVAVCLVAIPVTMATGIEPLWPVVTSLLYVSNVRDYLGLPMGALGHTWTLAIEEQFYLIWPLLLLWARTSRARLAACAVGLAVLLLVPASGYAGALQDSWRIAIGLPAGCALAFWLRRRALPYGQVIAGVCGAVLLAGATAGWFGRLPGWHWALVPTLLSVGLIAGAIQSGAVSRALSAAPLVWVGVRSYGVYLWHYPVLQVVAGAVDLPWWGVLSVGTVATLVTAALSYRFLEHPVRAYVRARTTDAPVPVRG